MNLSWKTLDQVILANSLANQNKLEVIQQASASFDQLKTRLRMAHELKLISHKKHAFILQQNEEIGRMLSGWLKWAKKQQS